MSKRKLKLKLSVSRHKDLTWYTEFYDGSEVVAIFDDLDPVRLAEYTGHEIRSQIMKNIEYLAGGPLMPPERHRA